MWYFCWNLQKSVHERMIFSTIVSPMVWRTSFVRAEINACKTIEPVSVCSQNSKLKFNRMVTQNNLRKLTFWVLCLSQCGATKRQFPYQQIRSGISCVSCCDNSPLFKRTNLVLEYCCHGFCPNLFALMWTSYGEPGFYLILSRVRASFCWLQMCLFILYAIVSELFL